MLIQALIRAPLHDFQCSAGIYISVSRNKLAANSTVGVVYLGKAILHIERGQRVENPCCPRCVHQHVVSLAGGSQLVFRRKPELFGNKPARFYKLRRWAARDWVNSKNEN
jgi:hypothetical protein